MQPFLLREFLGNLEMTSNAHGKNKQDICRSVMKLIQDGVIKLPSGKPWILVSYTMAFLRF